MKLISVWQTIRQKTDQRIRLIIIAFLVSIGFYFLDAALSSQLYYPGSFSDMLLYDVPAHHLYSRIFILLILLIYGFSLGNYLRRSESKEREYEMLLNTKKDAVMVHDMNDNFLEANSVATQQLGYTRSQLLKEKLTPVT